MYNPCLFCSVSMKFDPLSKHSWVHVSSYAMPLPKSSTLSLLRFKYSSLMDDFFFSSIWGFDIFRYFDDIIVIEGKSWEGIV